MRSLPFYSKRKKAAHPEAKLQKVIVGYLRMSGAFFFSIPNEGKRDVALAVELIRMGMLPGVADLCIIVDGKAHFMEVKSDKGRPSQSQIQFAADCYAAGIPHALVNNISDALKTLTLWGAIKPARVAA